MLKKMNDNNKDVEPRGKSLINRYKSEYKIPGSRKITERLILRHWTLEKKFARDILNSHSTNRLKIIKKAYAELYNRFPWINLNNERKQAHRYSKIIINILDNPVESIYEIGSGDGKLLNLLALKGFKCVGSEITEERGNCQVNDENMEWHLTDGIHLTKYENINKYDVALSNHVIEHLHPHDIDIHFKEVKTILNPGGSYIFTTPHFFMGPSDVSRVFKCRKAKGLHLKEYTFGELRGIIKKANYRCIYVILKIPEFIRRAFKLRKCYFKSRLFLSVFCFIEALLKSLDYAKKKKTTEFLKRYKLFSDSIQMIAEK